MATLSIPAFHVSDSGKVSGSAEIFIQSRVDAASTGIFTVKLGVHFDPGVDEYPAGNINIKTNLSDGAKGDFNSTSIELINSHGKHNPTIFITGRCKSDIQPNAKGCRFWLMIANNKTGDQQGTPDIVSFAVHDLKGTRIAYGTGPVRTGDFDVQS